MNIWEIDKLVIFIAFVIPGFITLKTYELLNPAQIKESSKQIVDAITYSSINYALLLLPIYKIETSALQENCPSIYIFLYTCILFVCPVVLAFIWDWIRGRECVQKKLHHPKQKPWDWVFSKRKPQWIKVILKDGEVVGGLYAEKSFCSSSPSEEQIYLQETWIINSDGGFDRVKSDSEGIIILASEIKYVELIKYGE